MRQFLIFSIFLYFASVNIFSSGHPTPLTGKQLAIMKECAQEYNANEKNYTNGVLEALVKNRDEATCMLACDIRKNFAKQVTVSDLLKTWYNASKILIEQASRNGFEQGNRHITIQDITNSVENCYSNAKNECDFLNCTDLFKGPLWAVFFYLGMHPPENPILPHELFSIKVLSFSY